MRGIDLFKIVIDICMKVVGMVITYSFIKKVHHTFDIIYSMWIKNFIGFVGKGSLLAYPCKLEGGGSKNIKIGSNTVINSHSIIGCWKTYGNQSFTPEIILGDNCSIGEYNHISAIKKITIGDGLLTGRFVFIGDNSHGCLSWEESSVPPAYRKLKSKGEITIGKNVWIGDKSTILGGVSIGDNVIIGANSVLTHDVPSNCIVGGGKLIKVLSE